MNVEIISVGTELLLGLIPNTNAQFLAGRLAELGFELYCQTVVGDNAEHIRVKLEDAYRNGCELVILTGAVGPEKDAAIREMIASLFGKCLDYEKDNVSSDVMILPNETGTTPGFVMEKDGKAAVLLPGQARELEPMFETCVNRYLHNLVDRCEKTVLIRLKSDQEAPAEQVSVPAVRAKLEELIQLDNPSVEVSTEDKGTRIRITAAAPTSQDALIMANIVAANCIQLLGEKVISSMTQDK